MNKKDICELHDKIMEIAASLAKTKPSEYDTPQDLWRWISSEIDDIYSLADDAKAAGQSMENRLKLYREAIEGLGFTRDNPIKK